MPLGPGKYDDLCSELYKRAGVGQDGGVAVIVLNGKRGNGFSVQADLPMLLKLADILEYMAKELRASGPLFPS
jgi:enoyl-CoA hydratase/carnithine racemase